MQRAVLLLLIITSILLISCSKIDGKNMVVVKDCTGSYLRLHDKDYQVCNIEIVEDFEDGSRVKASFERIDSCENNWIACFMYHENEGWINITEIE